MKSSFTGLVHPKITEQHLSSLSQRSSHAETFSFVCFKFSADARLQLRWIIFCFVVLAALKKLHKYIQKQQILPENSKTDPESLRRHKSGQISAADSKITCNVVEPTLQPAFTFDESNILLCFSLCKWYSVFSRLWELCRCPFLFFIFCILNIFISFFFFFFFKKTV